MVFLLMLHKVMPLLFRYLEQSHVLLVSVSSKPCGHGEMCTLMSK